jgi:hypothetical protein
MIACYVGFDGSVMMPTLNDSVNSRGRQLAAPRETAACKLAHGTDVSW